MIISLFMETPMCCRSDHSAGADVEQARRGRGDQPDGQRQPHGFDHQQNQNILDRRDPRPVIDPRDPRPVIDPRPAVGKS
jgi:hypothetical protein